MSSNTRIGMIRCEHCGRQFNPHSGARHIPWCANQKSEQRKHKLSSEKREALERYKWRISYRPSNQFSSASQQRQGVGLAGHEHNRIAKKSSTNSSATLSSASSASASSTASVASTLNETRQTIGAPPARLGHQPASNNLHYSQPTGSDNRQSAIQVGQLKRSASSLTMIRQPGNISIVASSGYGQQATNKTTGNYSRNNLNQRNLGQQQQQLRAKSVSDLYNMSEIVETLSKRMDEIYAQNQLLLARVSASANDSSKNGLSAGTGRQSPEDSCSDNGEDSLVRCHHCKSSCLESANYCHKCGCKVRASTPSTPG